MIPHQPGAVCAARLVKIADCFRSLVNQGNSRAYLPGKSLTLGGAHSPLIAGPGVNRGVPFWNMLLRPNVPAWRTAVVAIDLSVPTTVAMTTRGQGGQELVEPFSKCPVT